jgi:hypothetical protein
LVVITLQKQHSMSLLRLLLRLLLKLLLRPLLRMHQPHLRLNPHLKELRHPYCCSCCLGLAGLRLKRYQHISFQRQMLLRDWPLRLLFLREIGLS